MSYLFQQYDRLLGLCQMCQEERSNVLSWLRLERWSHLSELWRVCLSKMWRSRRNVWWCLPEMS
jgi:hypothetical protein